MRKLIIFTSLFFIGCRPENVKKITTDYVIREGLTMQIVIIDSCEYLYGPWDNATVLTHKGNCKNH
jgi:hypothetical protein